MTGHNLRGRKIRVKCPRCGLLAYHLHWIGETWQCLSCRVVWEWSERKPEGEKEEGDKWDGK